MSREALASTVWVALGVAVLPAGGATLRAQQETTTAGTGSPAVLASERSNDFAAARMEGDANLGGAAYTPFVETPARPARPDVHADANRGAKGADLTLSALAALAAVGALVYLVRRAWSA